MNPILPTDASQLDPKIVKVMQAIKHIESGGDYNAVGDKGESHGAYQWNKNNFHTQATQFGLDPNDFTPANQNKVAYARIKSLKDQGRQPEEIAAIWNGAHKTPQGTYDYNNPEYGNKFRTALGTPAQSTGAPQTPQPQNPSIQSGYVPVPELPPAATPSGDVSGNASGGMGGAPASPQPQTEQPLMSKLNQRVQDAGQAITDSSTGKQGKLSGLLQVGGAIAGGLGDVTSSAIEHTPIIGGIFKGLESVIGSGVSAFAKTDTGKGVFKSVQDFSEKHPELSKDLGAGFNILSAIPVLKGLGVAKNLAMDAASMALKSAAEKQVETGLTKVLSSSMRGRDLLERNPTALKTLIKERAIPDIEGGKYTTAEASAKLDAQISHIEETELQPALERANTSQVASRIPLEEYRKKALGEAVDELKSTAPVEAYFDRLKAKYGDYPSLQQMNEAKRIVARNISEAGFNSPTYSTDKIVRSALQQSVEDGAKALGLPDVNEINGRMAELIRAQKVLEKVEGRSVKTGIVGEIIQGAATAAGEAAGGATGIPMMGAIGGYKAGGFAGKRLTGINKAILDRTSKDTMRDSVAKSTKKTAGALGALFAQKETNRR